jgi:hypothetical protein
MRRNYFFKLAIPVVSGSCQSSNVRTWKILVQCAYVKVSWFFKGPSDKNYCTTISGLRHAMPPKLSYSVLDHHDT